MNCYIIFDSEIVQQIYLKKIEIQRHLEIEQLRFNLAGKYLDGISDLWAVEYARKIRLSVNTRCNFSEAPIESMSINLQMSMHPYAGICILHQKTSVRSLIIIIMSS